MYAMERLLLTADAPWEAYSMNNARCPYYLVKGGRTSQHTGRAVTVELFLTGLPRLSGRAEANLQRIIKALNYSFNRVL